MQTVIKLLARQSGLCNAVKQTTTVHTSYICHSNSELVTTKCCKVTFGASNVFNVLPQQRGQVTVSIAATNLCLSRQNDRMKQTKVAFVATKVFGATNFKLRHKPPTIPCMLNGEEKDGSLPETSIFLPFSGPPLPLQVSVFLPIFTRSH